MITVADVKKHIGKGFEFVVGDLIYSQNPDNATALSERDVVNINLGNHLQHRGIVELIERQYTGQPITCGNVVDVLINGEWRYGMSAGGLNWDKVEYWKPCLKWLQEQVDKDVKSDSLNAYCDDGEVMPDFPIKPVYMQEMHDAGELPMVGARYAASGGEFECMLEGVEHTHKTVCGKADDGYIAVHWLAVCKPIQTERDKAIEAMIDKVTRRLPACATIEGCKIQGDTLRIAVETLCDVE